MPLPELNIPAENPNPVEALPAPNSEARAAAATVGLGQSLGVSLEGKVIGKFRGTFGTPEQRAWVNYDDAKAEMEHNGYDSHVLPQGGLTRGELDTIMSQQSAIRRNQAVVQQSHLSGFQAGAAEIAGGAADPVMLAAGPVLGRIATVAKMGLAGRLAFGAGEGAVTSGAYMTAAKEYGTAPGDRDMGTDEIVKNSVLWGLGGAVLHGAFGPRAAVKPENLAILDQHKEFLQDNLPGVSITSGVRDQAKNMRIGGAMRSMHLSGQAIDFVPEGPRWGKAELDAFRAKLQAKGLPVTELFVETEKSPHSTGYHVHWGWGEKGRPSFGLQTARPPSHISMDWTQLEPEDHAQVAQRALDAAALDAKPDIFKGLGVEAAIRSRGELGPTSPIYWNTGPAGLDERYMNRFGGITEPVGNRVYDEDYMRRFGGETSPVPMQGHIPADWMEHLPAIEQRGPMTPMAAREAILQARARGVLPELPPKATPEEAQAILADVMAGLKQRFGIGTPYGPKPLRPESPPQPGSIFEAPPQREPIRAEAELAKAPATQSAEMADLKAQSSAAVAEAKARPSEAEIHPGEAALADVEDELHAGGFSAEMVKAIKAAVRCALVNGIE